MTFASQRVGMLCPASSLAVALTASLIGCITTSPIEFSEEENFPPSAVSQENAQYPLREIGMLNLDDPVDVPELPLEVVVRDPNVDQTLEYRLFLDSPTPPGTEIPIDDGTIEPTGATERERVFTVPYDALAPGECHKIELTIVGSFASFVQPRLPEEEGDIDNRTWWIEVTDTDSPVIEVECR